MLHMVFLPPANILFLLKDHPYIMSDCGLGGWVQKMAALLTFSTVFMLT